MWRAIGASVRGTSHVRSDLPCQDACDYRRTYLGGEPAMMIAIADGAGSAKASDVGSKAAVEYLLEAISAADKPPRHIDDLAGKDVLLTVRDRLDALAEKEGFETRDLACTALVAVLGETESVFFQVGDGAWIAECRGECQAVTWPISGEYANETTFMTSPNWEVAFQFQRCSGSPLSVAGFTDGIQALALHYASRSVHAPFFAPLFSALHRTEDETSLQPPLLEFLDSALINERTDDDKTLVLAAWMPSLTSEDGSHASD